MRIISSDIRKGHRPLEQGIGLRQREPQVPFREQDKRPKGPHRR